MMKLFSIPVFADLEMERKATFLYKIILGTLLIITSMLFLGILILPQNLVRYSILILIFFIGSLFFLYVLSKGHVRKSSLLYVIFMFAVIYGAAWTGGGIKSHAIRLLPIIVLFTGLTLDRKYIWLFGILACIANFILVIADYYDYLPLDEAIGTKPMVFFLISSTCVILLCTLESISVTSLNLAFKAAKNELLLRTQSEEKYRTIFESFQDVYYQTDLDGTITLISPSIKTIAGYDPITMVGRNVSEFYVDPESRNGLMDMILNNGTIQNYEFRMLSMDKRILHVLASSHLIFNEDGTPKGIEGTLHDITQIKLTEKALSVSEERYKSIISVSNIGAWEYQSETENLWCSPEYFEMLGRNRDDYITKGITNLEETWFAFLHPEDLERAKNHFKDYLKNGSMGTYESYFRLQHKDGSWVWIWSRGETIRDANGNATQLTVGTHIDVSKRNQMEADLRLSEQKFHIAFSLSPDSIILTEFESEIIIEANDGIQRIFGYSREEAIGHTCFELGMFKNPHECELLKNELEQNGGVNNMEIIGVHKTGMEITILISMGRIEVNGKPCIVATARDISERKAAEAQLQQLNITLEERVANRTKELENVNHELESFSYSVSHDLRSPLRAISGYAKILKEDSAAFMSEEANEQVQIILKNSNRMSQLIDDLLAFSKLGRKNLTTSEIDMNELLVTIINEDFYEKPFNVELIIHPLHPAIGDHRLIKQVWINLISNAFKYSRNNPSPRIEIGSTFKLNEIEYYVKDNGAGFNMEYYHRLFGVFQRLHSQDEFEGTGIGLAAIQKIVQRHKGNVWAESKLNEGAIFYFTLPIANY